MSKLTEVLKLLCYDPETDGNLTFNVTEALTKNWEKIDQLVLLAVAAAAAYDPEGSYAVGDYCTHGGKLHKCNTAIPDGEAWTAEHWTETSVASELAEVRASLSNKLSLSGGTMSGMISFGNNRWVSGGATSTQIEMVAGKASIRLIPENAVGNDISQCVMIRDTGSGSLYPIATATPPEETALPLADGISNLLDAGGFVSRFSKDQFGKVHVFVAVQGEFTNAIPLFTLPEDCRPSESTAINAYCNTQDNAFIKIGANGICEIFFGRGEASCTNIVASGDFYAAK